MSQGPGGGGDSQDREDHPADAGPGSNANGPGGATDGQESSANGQEGSANGQESRSGGRDSGGSRGEGSGGDTYDLYQRGLDLLSRGSAAAAAQLLARANTAEPGSRSVLEALARAQFDAHRYGDAADSFRQIVEASPADDYAQFGLGLSLARTGNPRGAAEHLALAAAMRPDLRHYADALRGVRATLRARREAGLPDQISPGERSRVTGTGPETGPGSGPGSGAGPGQPGPGPGLSGTGPA
jgi:TolA-binding protein